MKKILSTIVAVVAALSFAALVSAADSATVHPFENNQPQHKTAKPVKKHQKKHHHKRSHHKAKKASKEAPAPAPAPAAPAPQAAPAPPAAR